MPSWDSSGIGELLLTTEEGLRFEGIKARVRLSEIGRTLIEIPRYWLDDRPLDDHRHLDGITPAGPTPPPSLSYGVAGARARHNRCSARVIRVASSRPRRADHSAGTSALLPMLALGVPGSATAAVMMGGLMIWGLTPRPDALSPIVPDFVWGLIASMYLGNVVAVFLVIATVAAFTPRILRVPFSIIDRSSSRSIFSGAYQVANSVSDNLHGDRLRSPGLYLQEADYPLAPLVLAMVLGDKAEDAFRQSMLMSGGSLNIFWSNGLVSALMAVALALLLSPLFFWLIGTLRQAQERGCRFERRRQRGGLTGRLVPYPQIQFLSNPEESAMAPRKWNRDNWPIAAAMISIPNLLPDGRSVQDPAGRGVGRRREPTWWMPASPNWIRPTAGYGLADLSAERLISSWA